MTTYTVTVNTSDPDKPAAFFGLSNYDPDAFAEFVSSDGKTEVYTITTDADLDHFLDMAPGVITYTVS